MCEILRNHIKMDILGDSSIEPGVLAMMRYVGKDSWDRRSLADYSVVLRKDWPVDFEKMASRRKPECRKKKMP